LGALRKEQIGMVGTMRRARLAVVAVALFALPIVALGVATDRAGAINLGHRYVTSACCVLRGTRAHIKSPAWNIHTSPTGGLALMRVVAQNGGLVQTGFGTAPIVSFDMCGSRATNTVFWEYSFYPGNGYTCNWLGTFGATPTNKKYAVVRTDTCSTCWYVFVDGSLQVTTPALGFSTAFEVYAGGEFNAINDGASYGCYGCDGQTPWQRTSDVYPGTWTTIQSANAKNNDGLWSLGNPPSPFTISH
jgi:hypothetical protein